MTTEAVYLTSGQAAERLGVARQTVYRWARDGLIEAILLPSGRRRFRAEDIDRLLEPKRQSA